MNQLTNKLLAYPLTGPGIQPSDTNVGSAPQIENIISAIIGIMTIIGVIYFTIQIILAGFTMIASQGDPKELESAKKRLTTNVMGLAIIILAYGLGALIANLLGMSSVFNLQTFFSKTIAQ
ncbi:MAG: hypothetical protein PHE32_00630 [Candidatus Shapirobacteria bacterium]|nr:hypothetical protein [Candidatus Shapirobacteria bacterium]MDD4410202.1 hypothetical protein [Candidatus Shapirobacteria bacterium]